MFSGDIGYNGQFYLPPWACLVYAVKANDLELVRYYLLRYFANDLYATELAIVWSQNFGIFTAILFYYCYKYSNTSINNLLTQAFTGLNPDIASHIARVKQLYDTIPNTNDFATVIIEIDSGKIDNYVGQEFPEI